MPTHDNENNTVSLEKAEILSVRQRKSASGNTFFNTEIAISGTKTASITSPDVIAWPGQKISLTGKIQENKVKTSFQTVTYTNIINPDITHISMPTDTRGLANFLENFSGIGKKTAERIAFRLRTTEEIDRQIASGPDNPIKSITGKAKYEKFVESWKKRNLAASPTVLFLRSLNITMTQIPKIINLFGDSTEREIRSNPYTLIGKIRGFSFDKCDKIAEELGVPRTFPTRINAAIANCIKISAREEGHCYLTQKELLNRVAKAGIPNELAIETLKEHPTPIIKKMEFEGEIIWTIPRLFSAEKNIAKNISERLSSFSRNLPHTPEKILNEARNRLRIPMNDGQKKAFTNILAYPISALTGGPGTGKTHLLKAVTTSLIQLCGWNKNHIILVSPTGRGAVNMTKSTKLPAQTIASLIKMSHEEEDTIFRPNDTNNGIQMGDKLANAKLLICDETSMADTINMSRLLSAIPKTCRVLFVGDPEQLLPVGPGNPFLSFIESGAIPVSILSIPERQDKNSQIVKVAQDMKEGRMPPLTADPQSDWMFIRTKKNEDILSRIVDIANTRLPNSYQYDKLDDIQVIAPQKSGPVGTTILNERLREAINPKTAHSKVFSEKEYRINEKIMQTANNWSIPSTTGDQTEVANGEIGILKKIEEEKEEAIADYPRSSVVYDADSIEDTSLAYAVSTHKMQGSEYPAILYPLTMSQAFMLTLRQVRTALTRARQKAIFIGQPDALWHAINNRKDNIRNTMLTSMLLGKFPKEIQ